MSAIKKTTKAAKSPAPATKASSTKTPAKPAVRKTATASAARPTTQAPVTVTPPPAPATTATTPTIKAIAAKPVVTTLTARIDVGFGNALFVRGEGPGLSWDKGVAMNCLASDLWQLSLGEASRPFVFKFLVNDLTWNKGADYTLESGHSVTLTPEF